MSEGSEDIVSVFVRTDRQGSQCEVEMCSLDDWMNMSLEEREEMVNELMWNVLEVHIGCPTRSDLKGEDLWNQV